MKTVCLENDCAGCKLCTDICPMKAIHIEDSINAYNAVIDADRCIDCKLCHSKCPQNSKPPKNIPLEWYQGYCTDDIVRLAAPSGGIGIALMNSFTSKGGYVVSCEFKNGKFGFGFEDKKENVIRFMGSKYVKSDPEGIYLQIIKLLKEGEKVLFIGLPCQCAALKNYVGEQYLQRLYLVDLICHGTPSPRLLEMFLQQYSKSLSKIHKIGFRIKAKMQLVIDDEGIVCKGVTDKYTTGFLNGLTYTENCYRCNYASEDRCTDITIGDSWGTQMSVEESKKGLSLILVQTQKGLSLLEDAEVKLYPADKNIAMANNEQLIAPMKMPFHREAFFYNVNSDNFNKKIFRRYTAYCIKQDIKYIMLKLKLKLKLIQ